MKPKALHQLGVPKDPATTKTAGRAVSDASRQGMGPRQIKQTLREVIADPDLFTEDPVFGRLAQALAVRRKNAISSGERDTPAPYTSWGTNLDANAVQQMENACRLPISLAGALLPDAHMGYGLPIGGVLAVNNAVIPYAVGVDIACRMRMSVLDMPPDTLDTHQQRFIQALDKETRFGVGASFSTPRKHKVLDEDWGFSTVTRRVKDKAYAQLGTSGSGNHFAEFGLLTLDHDDLGLTAGTYLALLTHSG
ncbi:MAG: RtcB family protein, partial [Desulfovibrio sp.]